MNERHDRFWRHLVAQSAPTFEKDSAPPFGFITCVLAQVREEKRQREAIERMGLRAIFAAFALLLITLGVTVGTDYSERGDLEPGLTNLLQSADVQVS